MGIPSTPELLIILVVLGVIPLSFWIVFKMIIAIIREIKK